MFPHTITIYRHEIIDGEDTVSLQIVTGVYIFGGAGIAASGNGTVKSNAVTIITSPETTAGFGTKWTVQPDDRIVEGEGEQKTRLKDIHGWTVRRVDKNICGSCVDNITITGE